MKNKRMFLSLNTVKSLIKGEGARRVSKKTAIMISGILELYAKKLAKRAIKNAFYKGRKTIKEEDVEEL